MMSRFGFPLLALVMAGCGGRDATDLVTPAQSSAFSQAAAPSMSRSSERRGALHITKNCLHFTGAANGYCVITSSNIKQIPAGTRVVYLQAYTGNGVLESDVRLDTPGPSHGAAFGHCHLPFPRGPGLCTFSGGTGRFKHFTGSAVVTALGASVDRNWAWNGTYSFGKDGDNDDDDGEGGEN